MIDLHLHTTASDGRSTPEELVDEALVAGCRTIAVTDHDTVAGLTAARLAADLQGLELVDGIEMTAVLAERDIHILGYFIDPSNERLASFLAGQRVRRRERLEAMAELLGRLGAPVDITPLVGAATSGKALGRPALAALLVSHGHARDVQDAFGRYLAEGRPAYVTREGARPEVVIAEIHAAGGLASIAHPGKLADESLVGAVIEAGLDAVEVFHPDHTRADEARYEAIATDLGLLTTGGSDYHGPGGPRAGPGSVTLSAERFTALRARVSETRA